MSPQNSRDQPNGIVCEVSFASKADRSSGLGSNAMRSLLPALRVMPLGRLVGLLVPEPRDDRPDVLVRQIGAERLHPAVRDAGAAQGGLHRAAALDHREVGAVGQVALRAQELVVDEARRDALL